MRVVVDPGVLIAALLTPDGPPAALVEAVRSERLEIVVSPMLLGELVGVLTRPKFRVYTTIEEAHDYVDGLARVAITVADPASGEPLTTDPDDDYLVRLARVSGADLLVSGDRDLLEATVDLEVVTPRAFVALLGIG